MNTRINKSKESKESKNEPVIKVWNIPTFKDKNKSDVKNTFNGETNSSNSIAVHTKNPFQIKQNFGMTLFDEQISALEQKEKEKVRKVMSINNLVNDNGNIRSKR